VAAACLGFSLSLRVLKLMSALVARSGADRGVVTMPHRSACLITALGFAATRERRIAYKAVTHRWGHIGKDDYQRERAAIEAELAQLQGQPAVPSVRQFSARITDLVAAWEDSTPDQRSRLASSILSEIQVKDRTIIAVRPRPGWASYFEELLRGVAFLERETSLELATSTLATLRSTN
jgi:hypothetical protein